MDVVKDNGSTYYELTAALASKPRAVRTILSIYLLLEMGADSVSISSSDSTLVVTVTIDGKAEAARYIYESATHRRERARELPKMLRLALYTVAQRRPFDSTFLVQLVKNTLDNGTTDRMHRLLSKLCKRQISFSVTGGNAIRCDWCGDTVYDRASITLPIRSFASFRALIYGAHNVQQLHVKLQAGLL